MATFYTSDLHFSHANIIKYCNRPFENVAEMDAELARRWNERVGENDVIYCLGDFSMSYNAMVYWTARLNGRKFLVPGNHDHCHPRKPKRARATVLGYEKAGWNVLETQVRLIKPPVKHGPIDRIRLSLCHFPYSSGYPDERYPKYRAQKGDEHVLLCGHVHEKWKFKEGMINVGVDVWDYRPHTLEEMMEEYDNR